MCSAGARREDGRGAALFGSDRNGSIRDKIKITVREAYKILRPGGASTHGVRSYNSRKKITGMRGWCIPAQGKDYEVKDKRRWNFASENNGSELVSDVKDNCSASLPQIRETSWGTNTKRKNSTRFARRLAFSGNEPVREAHYTLQLPSGWEYKATWMNYPEVKPLSGEPVAMDRERGQGDQARRQYAALAGRCRQMIVSFFRRWFGAEPGFQDWKQMGIWYQA